MQISELDSMKLQKSYQVWRKCMIIGEHTGCHQLPERSFFYKGYQFPVCARCTGVILGYILAIPNYIIFGFCKKLSFIGSLGMLVDWLLQACKIKSSKNKRRFLTGILGGFGIMSIEINTIIKLVKLLTYKNSSAIDK